ncbi:MAG: hypothetical protein H0V88_04410 [Pyrinomonadaceae bacterium]|nr:hypothetical protein [Pyrinomonadaceae bacterium]
MKGMNKFLRNSINLTLLLFCATLFVNTANAQDNNAQTTSAQTTTTRQPMTNKERKYVERMRARISKAGIGEKAKVEIKTRDNRKIKGYVSQAGEDSFVVVDPKTSQQYTIAYLDVVQVKGKGGSSAGKTARQILIGF